MIFFYELLFVAVALVAAVVGEVWSRTAAVLFLVAWWTIVALGHASFSARLSQARTGGLPELSDEDQRWYRDAVDGLRHLRLLFALAVVVALVWRVAAG